MSGASSGQVHELGQKMLAEVRRTEDTVRGMLTDLLPVLTAIEMVMIHGTPEEREKVADRVRSLRYKIKDLTEGLP